MTPGWINQGFVTLLDRHTESWKRIQLLSKSQENGALFEDGMRRRGSAILLVLWSSHCKWWRPKPGNSSCQLLVNLYERPGAMIETRFGCFDYHSAPTTLSGTSGLHEGFREQINYQMRCWPCFTMLLAQLERVVSECWIPALLGGDIFPWSKERDLLSFPVRCGGSLFTPFCKCRVCDISQRNEAAWPAADCTRASPASIGWQVLYTIGYCWQCAPACTGNKD